MATKRKVKRYNGEDGSVTDDDVSSFAGTPENDSNAGMAEARAASDAADAKAKPKPAIVTKEQLAAFQSKHGADKTLRDYMNAQQGLTRRGGAAPERVASAVKDVKADIKAQESANKSKPKMNILEAAKENARRRYAASQAVAEANRPKRTPTLASKGPGMGALTGMKKGGMTASKRADGIAVRGKTRGKLY